MKNLFLALILSLFSLNSTAQVDTTAVKSIEGITELMLEMISGEIGEERDWEAYRNLFLPSAQKIVVDITAPPRRQVRVMNLEEFVRNIGPLYSRDGFEEIVIGVEIDEYNGIANVFQSFQCKNLLGTYEARGINSYQLVFADGRWWIASVMFTNETEEQPIPEEYLFEGK